MQINPGGNRRLNWALHMVALVRLRVDGRSKEFVSKRVADGKSKRRFASSKDLHRSGHLQNHESLSRAQPAIFLLTAIYQVRLIIYNPSGLLYAQVRRES